MKSDSDKIVGEENILIVDDSLESLQSLSATLSQNGYAVQSVISGSMALTVAQLTLPDLILLDIKMPDMDGYEVCKHLKESQQTSDIPIIFLSCLYNVSEKIKAFNMGGVDYVTKPFQVEEILVRVKHQLTIQKLTRQIKEKNQQLQNEIVQRRKAELKAVSASQAKSSFLASMSHELRTPLNAIIGFSKLMCDDHLLNTDQQENINIINRSALHLLELINDILKLSKIEAGIVDLEKECLDLYYFISNIEEVFQANLKQKNNIKLNFIIAPNVPQYICADAKKLRSCLNNLISNAIKFTHQGSVTLRVSLAEKYKQLKVEEEKENSSIVRHLIFEVEDTGCGISPHELDNLFDEFIQADAGIKSLQGTGLGLAITRKFVQMMGGEIQVISTVGEGSIFKFYIELDIPQDDELTSIVSNYDKMRDLNTSISNTSLLEELIAMPQSWLLNLYQAANEVNEDLLKSLLEEIPQNKNLLSESLAELVKNFRLDIIVNYIQKILDKRVGSRE